MGVIAELKGHNGCVNCVEWSNDGRKIVSGSDDTKVNVWCPYKAKLLASVATKHGGNIFSVKFQPQSGDGIVISGAADRLVMVNDVEKAETIRVFNSHFGRVKRLEVIESEPQVVFSAAEDGLVLQTDLRTDKSELLANLNGAFGHSAEAKCVASNPFRPERLAVGANDPYVRLYDRRRLRTRPMPEDRDGLRDLRHFELENGFKNCLQYFSPGHLPGLEYRYRRKMRVLTTTFVAFSPDRNGADLLANIGGEQIYIFDTENAASVSLLAHNKSIKLGDAVKAPNARLNPNAESLKVKANEQYNDDKFWSALKLYNEAIKANDGENSVLYANRAAAAMKRSWDGDVYAALKDCKRALELDPAYVKAHLRLAGCLLELDQIEESRNYLEDFKGRFPDCAESNQVLGLDAKIVQRKVRKATNGEEPEESSLDAYNPTEVDLRDAAVDFKTILSGHCKTTTDIKEANFLGNSDFVGAGSDDGRFFVWDVASRNLIGVFEGDENIVNCIQPSPNTFVLATSGIDPVVRLWAPLPENVENEREIEQFQFEEISRANQRRMNADPMEQFMMSMAYEASNRDGDDADGEQRGDALQCPTS